MYTTMYTRLPHIQQNWPALLVPPSSGLATTAWAQSGTFSLIHLKMFEIVTKILRGKNCETRLGHSFWTRWSNIWFLFHPSILVFSYLCIQHLDPPYAFQPPSLFPFLLPWPITCSPISFQHIFTNTLANKSVPYILLTNILPANILQNILPLSLLPYII